MIKKFMVLSFPVLGLTVLPVNSITPNLHYTVIWCKCRIRKFASQDQKAHKI